MISTLTLLIIFAVSIVIILTLIGVNIYMLVVTRNNIKKINENISNEQAKLKKMNDDITNQHVIVNQINDDIIDQKINVKTISNNIMHQQDRFSKVNNEIINQKLSVEKVSDEMMNQKNTVDKYATQLHSVEEHVDVILSKINSGIQYKIDSTAISILDLSEFKDLDPYLKEAYKRYIVNILSSALMKGINKNMSDMDVKKYLSENQAELDKMAYDIATQLQNGNLNMISNIYP